MKKSVLILSLMVVSMLSISLVAASWFNSGITGNTIAEGTPKADSAKCQDSDGGIFANQAGFALKIGAFGNSISADSCSGTRSTFYNSAGKKQTGYSQITENYCDGNTKKSQVMNSTDLGAGYCIAATLTEEGKKIASAKWIPLPSVCNKLENGAVQDQNGNISRKGCYGADSKTFRSYSCNADNTTVVKTEQVCDVRCDALKGCVGSCTVASDGKSVVFDGKQYNNTCLSSKTIRKYSCQEGGYLSVDTANCGNSQECVGTETTAGYCREVIAGTATIASLQQQIADLVAQIQALTDRVEDLED